MIQEIWTEYIREIQEDFVFGIVDGRSGNVCPDTPDFFELAGRGSFMADTYGGFDFGIDELYCKVGVRTGNAVLAQTHDVLDSNEEGLCFEDSRIPDGLRELLQIP